MVREVGDNKDKEAEAAKSRGQVSRNEKVERLVRKGGKEGSLENCCPQRHCLIHALHGGAVWRRAASGQGKGSWDKLRSLELSAPAQGSNEVMELKRGTGEWRERHIKDIKQKYYLLLQYGTKPPGSLFHVFFGFFSTEAPCVSCHLSSKETPAKQAWLLTLASQSAVIYIAVPP